MRNFHAIFCAAITLLSACSPMTTPALRHETGDILPVKRVRVHGEIEKAVTHPIPTEGTPYAGVAQESSVFQGTHLGLGAAVGVHPLAEMQFSSYWMGNGAGWRIGGKTPIAKYGKFSAAALLRLGTYAGSGSFELLDTSGTRSDYEFSLSAKQIDLGFPISVKFGNTYIYSGVALIKQWIRGNGGGAPVTDISTDIVLNLGTRFPIYGALDADLELAIVKLGNRFVDESQTVSYIGAGLGTTF